MAATRSQFLLRTREPELLQGLLGDVDRTCRSQQAEQQGLGLGGVATLVRRRQTGGTELSTTGARDLDLDGDGADFERAIIKAVGAIMARALEKRLALGVPHARQQQAEQLAQAAIGETGTQGLLHFGGHG